MTGVQLPEQGVGEFAPRGRFGNLVETAAIPWPRDVTKPCCQQPLPLAAQDEVLGDALLLAHPPAARPLLPRPRNGNPKGRTLPASLPQVFPAVPLPRRVLWHWMLRTVAVLSCNVHYFHYRRVWKPPSSDPSRAPGYCVPSRASRLWHVRVLSQKSPKTPLVARLF